MSNYTVCSCCLAVALVPTTVFKFILPGDKDSIYLEGGRKGEEGKDSAGVEERGSVREEWMSIE